MSLFSLPPDDEKLCLKVSESAGISWSEDTKHFFFYSSNAYITNLKNVTQEVYYKRAPDRDPQGPRAGGHMVLRGGYWGSHPDDIRSASRHYPLKSVISVFGL